MNLAPVHAVLVSAFVWVWQTSLASVMLIGLVLAAQLVCRKWLSPRCRYALWLLVVLRMLMPAVPSTQFSVFNALRFIPADPRVSPSTAPPGGQGPSEGPALPLHSNGEEAPFASRPEIGSSRREENHHAVATLAVFWLIGVAGYLLVVLAQQWRLSLWLKSQKPLVLPRLTLIIEDAKNSLGLRRMEVPVFDTNALRAPSVFGFLRPRLLLSKEMLDRLSDQELRLVILHELVHVQRRDALLNWLLIFLQALHWFNPLVWLALRRLRSDRELVCDAAVMRHLAADERHAYGATLIKMLDYSPRAALVPSLVPILNHKSEMHRRITMIAQNKPTTRLAALASALLVLALGALTFTSAADKAPAPAVEKSAPDAESARQREAALRALRILQQELTEQDKNIQSKQKELDHMRSELGITDGDGGGANGGSPESEPLRRLQGLRIESMAEYLRIDTLYANLTNLSRADLRRALLTVVADGPLGELLNHQARTEQELAKLTEGYGSEHPDVKRVQVVLDTNKRQIEARLDGILIGLKAKREAERARLEGLEAEVQKAKQSDLKAAIERRGFFQAKRDLENLQYIREKLMMRIIQEKIEAALPK